MKMLVKLKRMRSLKNMVRLLAILVTAGVIVCIIMKKYFITVAIMTTLGLFYNTLKAYDMFDFKSCKFHGVDYNLVLNHLQCPLYEGQYDEATAEELQIAAQRKQQMILDGIIPENSPIDIKTLVVHDPECYGTSPGWL